MESSKPTRGSLQHLLGANPQLYSFFVAQQEGGEYSVSNSLDRQRLA
jgi:hypothetical protein